MIEIWIYSTNSSIMTFIKKINCRKRLNSQRRHIEVDIVDVSENLATKENFIFVRQQNFSFFTKVLTQEARILTKKKHKISSIEFQVIRLLSILISCLRVCRMNLIIHYQLSLIEIQT